MNILFTSKQFNNCKQIKTRDKILNFELDNNKEKQENIKIFVLMQA
jgi:hypothetical protein